MFKVITGIASKWIGLGQKSDVSVPGQKRKARDEVDPRSSEQESTKPAKRLNQQRHLVCQRQSSFQSLTPNSVTSKLDGKAASLALDKQLRKRPLQETDAGNSTPKAARTSVSQSYWEASPLSTPRSVYSTRQQGVAQVTKLPGFAFNRNQAKRRGSIASENTGGNGGGAVGYRRKIHAGPSRLGGTPVRGLQHRLLPSDMREPTAELSEFEDPVPGASSTSPAVTYAAAPLATGGSVTGGAQPGPAASEAPAPTFSFGSATPAGGLATAVPKQEGGTAAQGKTLEPASAAASGPVKLETKPTVGVGTAPISSSESAPAPSSAAASTPAFSFGAAASGAVGPSTAGSFTLGATSTLNPSNLPGPAAPDGTAPLLAPASNSHAVTVSIGQSGHSTPGAVAGDASVQQPVGATAFTFGAQPTVGAAPQSSTAVASSATSVPVFSTGTTAPSSDLAGAITGAAPETSPTASAIPPSSSANAPAAFSFGGQASSAPAPAPFTFGAAPTASSTAQLSAVPSDNQSAPAVAAHSSDPAFTPGGVPGSSVTSGVAGLGGTASAPAFSFGTAQSAPVTGSSPSSAPAFSFGAGQSAPATAVRGPSPSSAPAFQFGNAPASQQGPAPGFASQPAASTGAFGSSALPAQPAPAFSFGGGTQPAGNVGFGAQQAQQQPAMPSFGFSQQGPGTGFGHFTGSPPAHTAAGSAPAPGLPRQPGSFAFGSQQQQAGGASTAGSFAFGQAQQQQQQQPGFGQAAQPFGGTVQGFGQAQGAAPAFGAPAASGPAFGAAAPAGGAFAMGGNDGKTTSSARRKVQVRRSGRR